ncbi:hypothetical protein ACJRO7_022062 [Eucalyptus globulus]|uniref:Thionin-like protein n=1 Tax=Eucalyptus globulus TaxID=34317 RepID=A0ABD3KPB4_EUCGL
MNFKSYTVLVMLVATMASQATVTEAKSYDFCSVLCKLRCAVIAKPQACIAQCVLDCLDDPLVVETLEGQCNLDCLTSKCSDLHSDAKKAEGCANSCSKGCKKS